MNIRTYSELCKLKTFEERFEYLKLNGQVGRETFGHQRFLNQMLYKCQDWFRAKRKVIIRDNGCDLGIKDREIQDRVIVHHMNPITVEDILNREPWVFDPEYLICVSHNTHNAIHYSDENILPKDLVERRPNDTCLWKQ